jgi:hypothetical protein
MTKIETKADRGSLDTSLGRMKDTLLVLSGSADTSAPAIYASAKANVAEPWRKTFWIADLGVLSTKELEDENVKLFARGGRYAVIGRCTDADGKQHRVVVLRGYHADLLDSGGEPDAIKIRGAFREGDKKRSC